MLKTRTRNNLKKYIRSYFDSEVLSNENKILVTDKIEKLYHSPFFGVIKYSFDKYYIDKSFFKKTVDTTIQQQWKENFLTTGSMPYSYCYGSSNYHSDRGYSEIYIENGGEDVVVLIKNLSNKVLRHVYIRAGHSFTLYIPNGTYNIFFYSGEGWNPNKVIKEHPCLIKGGFVLNESTGKDTYIQINNQILTYKLMPVINGNFQMEQSSISEAF